MPYLPADKMPYGTLVDVRIQINDSYYCIPAIVIDTKEHTAPYGVFQTEISVLDEGNQYSKAKKKLESGEGTGTSIVEWYTTGDTIHKGVNISKSKGLDQFDGKIDNIIYDQNFLGRVN